MTFRNNNKIEALLLLMLPIALFVGCAGNGATTTSVETLDFEEMRKPTIENELFLKNEEIEELAAATNSYIPLPEQVKNEQSTQHPASEQSGPSQHIFYFLTNSAVITTNDLIEIERHAMYLAANPNALVTVNGHADERGMEPYNESLSEKRAHAVAQLLRKHGVSADQIMISVYGERLPMNNIHNWAENRRVELEYSISSHLSSL